MGPRQQWFIANNMFYLQSVTVPLQYLRVLIAELVPEDTDPLNH